MKPFKTLALGLLAAMLSCNPAGAASPSELLQQGLYAEEVDGNLQSAIKTYGQVIADRGAAPNQIAQALYRQGMCYLKLKDEGAARVALEKLIADYPGQTELVEKVRPVLEDLTNFDPATLMPAGTLAYVEFGSPGRQIETILTMLKGTPFENPLAALGGQAPVPSGQKSPADLMGAFLNPSMVAEFKKIRGFAIGVTGIANNHPPVVAVLYPGKSDALRGLLLAGIGMVGKSAASIEGMQTVNIDGTGAVAYDDKVIIFAQPAEQLRWSVRQYKGLTSEPTLVSGNKSFARVGKMQRQKNAVTLWGDVDGVYAGMVRMFPDGKLPKEILSANALCDFQNIDELILSHSLEPNNLGSRAELAFKDGHHCLAYDLIRTPNINKAALDAVPARAIGLASFSLNQSDAGRAEKMRTQVQNVTGLDVGREIFANIEQVTLFAMPMENGFGTLEVVPSHLGLVITSRNPEQTRQLLATLLGLLAPGEAGQPGRYKISAKGGQNIYCHLEQVNGITLLSLNREIIDASIAALKSRKSVTGSGPLSGALGQFTPGTSKLVLVNVGGFMRLMGPQMNVSALNAEQKRQLNVSFEQLAHAADATMVELRTDEQPSQFIATSGISGVPPLNQILGPVTEIQRLTKQAAAETSARQLRQERSATISPAVKAPVIDGKFDNSWSSAHAYQLANVLAAPTNSPSNLAAEYRAMWDPENLYLLVDVTDGLLRRDPALAWQYNDGIELYIDARNSKSAEFGETDYQYTFTWDQSSPEVKERRHDRLAGLVQEMVATEKGYALEVKIPWTTLRVKPAAGTKIGLEVQINDNLGRGKRDGKIAWHDDKNDAWKTPQAFGNAELAGLIGWWKFDERQGTSVKDSSGGNHDGVFVGNVKWSNGKSGGGIDLDGHGSFIRINNDSVFNITGEITLASWVNMRSVPTAWMAIVTKGDSAWRLSTSEQLRKFHFAFNPAPNNARADAEQILSGNEWHHVAAVYDGNQMKIYVDGKLDATQAWKGSIAKNNAEVLIGENVEQPNRCFDGQLDDVRIYNYALGEDQIKAIAAAANQAND